MKIIDKQHDFYDYLQNIYRDPSITFDRTDSFLLTREIMCDYINDTQHFYVNGPKNDSRFVKLQVCNTFWLFFIKITSFNDYGRPKSYDAELLSTWHNYDAKRALIKIEFIDSNWALKYKLTTLSKLSKNREYDIDKIRKNIPDLIKAINNNDYRLISTVNSQSVNCGDDKGWEYRHIPLLKASGLSKEIDPLQIFLSLEEYFSLEKQSLERTESIGLTDNEKIENHGFDTKTSFRGK